MLAGVSCWPRSRHSVNKIWSFLALLPSSFPCFLPPVTIFHCQVFVGACFLLHCPPPAPATPHPESLPFSIALIKMKVVTVTVSPISFCSNAQLCVLWFVARCLSSINVKVHLSSRSLRVYWMHLNTHLNIFCRGRSAGTRHSCINDTRHKALVLSLLNFYYAELLISEIL